MKPRLARVRPAFTLIELLVAMALIAFIMAVLSQAFVEGLETFRQMKGIGDLDEKLRAAAAQLREDVAATHFQTDEFIRDTIRTGKPNPETVADLKRRYQAIHADAAALEPRLREVQRATTNPAARRVMKLTLQALAGVKLSATNAVELLELIDRDD